MSVSSVNSVSSQNSSAASSIAAAAAAKSLVAAALAEVSETAAQTKAEAMQGDPQAVRKLARLQTQTPQPKGEAAPTSMNAPDSTGHLFKATV